MCFSISEPDEVGVYQVLRAGKVTRGLGLRAILAGSPQTSNPFNTFRCLNAPRGCDPKAYEAQPLKPLL